MLTLASILWVGVGTACRESLSVDGVWEFKKARLTRTHWDTASRSHVIDADETEADADSVFAEAGFVVLDEHGQMVNSDKRMSLAAVVLLGGSDTVTARLTGKAGTAVLVGTSKRKREGADSTCRGLFSMCTGDTTRIELKRVGDRDGNLPADRAYLERKATLYSWKYAYGMEAVNQTANEINRNWSVGESLAPTNADYTGRLIEQLLKLKQSFDSSTSVHADTTALAYLRDVASLLGGMHAIASEMQSFNTLFTPGFVNSNAPGLGGVLARMKGYLRIGTTYDAAVAARIPELLRRLSTLEERAEQLRTREPQVQAFLSRKFGVPFPPIGAFEPALRPPRPDSLTR